MTVVPIARINAITHMMGTQAVSAARRIAVPAARRKVPCGREMRTHDRTANGKRIAAIVVPMRPEEIAPAIAGKSA